MPAPIRMEFLLAIIVLCMYEWLFGRGRQQQIDDLENRLADTRVRLQALEDSRRPVEQRAVDSSKAASARSAASLAVVAPPAAAIEAQVSRLNAQVEPAVPAAAVAAAATVPADPPPSPALRSAPVRPPADAAAAGRIAMPRPAAATPAPAIIISAPIASLPPPSLSPPSPPAAAALTVPAVPAKSLEESIVDWFAKFGAVFVFLALAALTAYVWNRIPIAGRVALFLCAGGAMLGAGVALEKRERYLILGRSLIGSGWATLFMTAFAMYHVEQIRVIDSLEVDLVLVLGVTAAMVRHTLRYESQLVTGLAVGLGFYTVAQSHV